MYIGIDLGTSSVKTILVSRDGVIQRTVSKNYDLIFPHASWSEQNPNDWYTQTMEALKELVVGFENQINGISFSGQMHGLVLLDEHDQILRNAILWNDQRTTKEVDYLNNEIGIDRLLEYTGNIALTGLTAPKILWVKHNEPEVFQKIKKIMLPKDYLIYKLSGEFASDVSDTSGTLYFDCKNKKYSSEMLDILGIHEDLLPKVYESYEVVGRLTQEHKDILKIKQDVNIIAGGGDQAVGAVGVGIVNDGECSLSLGTSGVIFVSSDQYKVDRESYFQSYAHANGTFHIMAVMLNAAGAMKWWNETIFTDKDYDSFYQNLSETNIDDTVFFLPYLTGERAPINNPYAKGVLFGFGIHHNKAHMDRAVVEGVTFALKQSFDLIQNLGVNISKVRITGGGAKSDVWAQMIADIFNVKVLKLASEEGPALGAAILAMVGCQEFQNVNDACEKIIQLDKEFKPVKENTKKYNAKFNDYIKLYPAIKTLYHS